MSPRSSKPRIGRPPRTDQPVRVNMVLPRLVWKWLVSRARAEARPRGDVVATALQLYERKVTRRKP
jgi:hypothetical protein